MAEMEPAPSDRLLDVGVIDTAWRSSNFLEARYPYRDQITAVGLEDMPAFRAQFPTVHFVEADGRRLPFDDDSFDIGFSNAVIEHVGGADDQRRFVHELVRTCRRVFLATPNAGFPIDPHTLLPFVHWLPRSIRHRVLHLTGNGRWASEAALRPIGANELRSFFPPGVPVRILRQRALGLTTVLIAITDSRDA
jgi:methyltransferase family protein